tara:strand:- start:775 stop:981 length:207 start_codon:yes stop_codon:yes gene_type:complete
MIQLTSSPRPTATSITGKPTAIPNKCGIERRMPRFNPEERIIILLGPGVIVITIENKKIDIKLFIVAQ